MIPFSILDLAPIRQGGDATQAFAIMVEQARHAERLGYQRYWIAEHHNIPGIGSSATSVLIGHVAGATRTIRVGSGGVMLPNHAPLVIAEQFGTLEALYPGRIDLGLGRAPGTDRLTMYALRRNLEGGGDRFAEDVLELQAFLQPVQPGQRVQAVPGAGTNVPLWLLGSSLYSAQLAAHLGLPFAFASHFAPEHLMGALAEYRAGFRPSPRLARPHAMAAFNVVAADTDAEARRLFTTMQQQFTNLVRGTLGLMSPPIDDIDTYWQPHERPAVERMMACSAYGAPDKVQRGIAEFIERTQVDELMITSRIFDVPAALHSLEIVAEVRDRLGAAERSGAAAGG